ncbi:MFS transporter [Okibacterium endophyticum]
MDISSLTGRATMSRYQILTVVVALFIVMVDGYDFIVVTFLAPLITTEFAAAPAQIGILLGGSTIGMVIGAFTLAPLADRVGRRTITVVSLALAASGMLLAAFAPGIEALVAARIATGIGIGGLMSSIGVILKEYSSPRRLGLVMGLFSASFGFGGALGGALTGPIVLASGWRAGFIVGAVLTGLAMVLAIVALAESLEFLATRKNADALERMNRVIGRIGAAPLPALPARVEAPKGRLREIFGAGVLSLTLLAIVGFALLQVSFIFVTTWTPQAVAIAGGSPQLSITSSVFMGLGGIVGSLLFGLISNWVKLWVLGTVSTVLAGVALIGVAVSTSAVGAIVAFAVAGAFMGLAGVTGFYALIPGLYPAHARASGFGIVLGVGRLAAIIGPVAAGLLLEAGWSLAAIYLLFGIPAVVSAVSFVALGMLSARRVSASPSEPAHPVTAAEPA